MQVGGTWTLRLQSPDDDINVWSWGLFVEGAERDSAGGDGLGAVVFEWGPWKDRALAGIAAPADDEAVRRALTRIKPAHTRASLIYRSRHVSGAAIPDDPEAIPGGCIPG